MSGRVVVLSGATGLAPSWPLGCSHLFLGVTFSNKILDFGTFDCPSPIADAVCVPGSLRWREEGS